MLAKRQSPISVKLPDYGIYVLESHHAPEFQMRAESHGFLELFFVLSGRGYFEIDEVQHACRKNDLMSVPPGKLHSIHDLAADPLALYAVCVSPEVPGCDESLFGRLPVGTVRVGNVFAGQTRSIFRQLLFEQTRQRPFGTSVIVGLTLQLLATLARRAGVHSDAATDGASRTATPRRAEVERYVADLAHRFFEHATIDSAAAELGMSRRRFTTLFAEVTGQTWADYVADLRIEYACKLLRETSRSVVAIAFECGFEEISSFYRAFKRQTGDSPGHWREGRRA
ncbi:MAG: AraC family transcriptional regulator [Planctomycetaceae bacterium]|nr:AraC family transcriptional regulator [Planctomycetaceae bacterium]